jgi:hypothetical protein
MRSWNTLIKFSGERLLVIACMDTRGAGGCSAGSGICAQWPPLDIWPWIIASAFFELLYRYLLIQRLSRGRPGAGVSADARAYRRWWCWR